MIVVDRPVAWALTALFAISGLWSLATAASCLLRGATLRRRDGEVAAANALVSVVMVASLWGWGAHLSTIAQITLFTAAAAWFAARVLVFDPPAMSPVAVHAIADEPARVPLTIRRWRREIWYQTALMGAMVWRAVALATVSAPGAVLAAGPIQLTAATFPDGSMPGMTMPGMTSPGTQAPGPATPSMHAPASTGTGGSAGTGSSSWNWVSVVSLLASIAFFVAAAWFLVAAARGHARRAQAEDARPGRDVLAALVAAGVAAVFAEMA